MADVDQSLASWIPLPVEVLVPRDEPQERPLQKCPRVRLVSCALVDPQHGGGVDGRLDHARRLAMVGGMRTVVCMPEVNPRKILDELRVEDDLGQQAVFPLAVEEVVQLLGGPALLV